MKEPTLAETVNALLGAAVPPVTKLGITIVDLEEGRAVSRVPFAGNSNHFGVMYAGSLFCVGEMLAGAIMAASFDFARAYPLIKNLTIDYLRPARGDVTAVATVDIDVLRRMQSDVEAFGKASWAHEVALMSDDGTLVATMRGEGQVRMH